MAARILEQKRELISLRIAAGSLGVCIPRIAAFGHHPGYIPIPSSRPVSVIREEAPRLIFSTTPQIPAFGLHPGYRAGSGFGVGNDRSFRQQADDLVGAGFHRQGARFQFQFGIRRFFIRRGNPGEILQFAGTGAAVVVLGVALGADIYRAIAVDFEKIAVLENTAHLVAVAADRRHEGRQHDGARLDEQLGHFADAADVFLAVLRRESQVAAQAVPDIVAVEHDGPASKLMQLFLYGVRNGRFAGTGQTGEPQHHTAMAVQLFTTLPRHGGMVPHHVGALWTFYCAHFSNHAFS